jgi:hypothetical protein
MKSRAVVLFLASFLAMILFFQITNASAAGIEDQVLQNPAGVGELTIQITQFGSVGSDGNPTKFTVNLETPQQNDRQSVTSPVNRITNEYSTQTAVIESTNPSNPFAYNFTTLIKSRASHLLSVPASYTIPADAGVFLQPTANIQSSDPAIRALAEQITSGSKDDFEKVAKLAMWVHDNLVYDQSYSGRNLDALSVLSVRRGVCAEYTTLFIALARSIGIPSRFISCYAYGQFGWERHAYAETYLGEWIPVDPLWMEVGFLDATHLKFGNYVDNRVSNTVTAFGYGLQQGPKFLEDNISLYTISSSQVAKASYALDVSSIDFRRGDAGVISLSIVPDEFIVGSITLEPCAGDQNIVTVENKEKNVILRPGIEEQIYWKIDINSDLPKNYIYMCPLTLNSRSLELKEANVTVNTQYAARTEKMLSARLYSSAMKIGDAQKVYIGLAGSQGKAMVGIIAGNEKQEWNVDGDFQTVYSFEPKTLGPNEVVVYSSEGEAVSLDYTVESDLRIAVQNFTVPPYVKTGGSINVSALILNRGATSESVHADLVIDGSDNRVNFVLDRDYRMSLPVTFASPGLKTIRLDLSGAGINISETRIVEAFDEPEIFYDTDYANGKAILKLDVQKSKILNVTIKVGGAVQKLGEAFGATNLEFSLSPGAYQLELACTDVAGNPLAISRTIEFREKNFFEQLLAMLNDFIASITSLFGAVGK